MLVEYGFVIPANPYDVFAFSPATVLQHIPVTREWLRELRRGAWKGGSYCRFSCMMIFSLFWLLILISYFPSLFQIDLSKAVVLEGTHCPPLVRERARIVVSNGLLDDFTCTREGPSWRLVSCSGECFFLSLLFLWSHLLPFSLFIFPSSPAILLSLLLSAYLKRNVFALNQCSTCAVLSSFFFFSFRFAFLFFFFFCLFVCLVFVLGWFFFRMPPFLPFFFLIYLLSLSTALCFKVRCFDDSRAWPRILATLVGHDGGCWRSAACKSPRGRPV